VPLIFTTHQKPAKAVERLELNRSGYIKGFRRCGYYIIVGYNIGVETTIIVELLYCFVFSFPGIPMPLDTNNKFFLWFSQSG
jgi:hypothetical protein